MRALIGAAALVLGGGAGAACTGDGGGGDAAAADRVGAAAARAAAGDTGEPGVSGIAGAATTTTTTAATSAPTTAGGTATSELPPLPPPQIPAHASPPTTGPETPEETSPSTGWPKVGEIIVDLEPGEYLDFPVEFQQGQHVELGTWADDGVLHEITVYAPDATPVADWRGGEPGTYTGYYWDAEEPEQLPATGPYVIRVRHIGGRDDPFVFAIYSEQPGG